MSNKYNILLDKLGKSGKDIFFLQIGAADGKSFDPLHRAVTQYRWKGVLVEPIKDIFSRLKENYRDHRNLIFENCAIDNESGTRKMKRVPLKFVENGFVPEWALGISSFYDDRNALGGVRVNDEDFNRIRSVLVEEEVNCLTVAQLLEKHDIKQIDILQIDAEGHDFQIFRHIDFSRYKPSIVNLEYVNLAEIEKKQLIDILFREGYKWETNGLDLLAYNTEKLMPNPKICFYSESKWALGAIHSGLCKQFREIGWIADLKSWENGYVIEQFQKEMENYDYIVTLPHGGTRPLLESYNIPKEKIIVVAHAEEDLINFIRHHGHPSALEGFAASAVVSDTLAASALTLGLSTPPRVVRLGVDTGLYRMPPAQRLDSVGYATVLERNNSFGVECKRGFLAREASEIAGLSFQEAGGLHYNELPSFYSSVGALILPSLQEGAGLPALEAAAAGRLVVGAPVGHFPRLAYEGLGILAPLDAMEFRRFAVSRLIYYKDNTSAYYDQCCSSQRAAEQRDWRVVISDWIDLARSAR